RAEPAARRVPSTAGRCPAPPLTRGGGAAIPMQNKPERKPPDSDDLEYDLSRLVAVVWEQQKINARLNKYWAAQKRRCLRFERKSRSCLALATELSQVAADPALDFEYARPQLDFWFAPGQFPAGNICGHNPELREMIEEVRKRIEKIEEIRKRLDDTGARLLAEPRARGRPKGRYKLFDYFVCCVFEAARRR